MCKDMLTQHLSVKRVAKGLPAHEWLIIRPNLNPIKILHIEPAAVAL